MEKKNPFNVHLLIFFINLMFDLSILNSTKKTQEIDDQYLVSVINNWKYRRDNFIIGIVFLKEKTDKF